MNTPPFNHYYGDKVRMLFISGALIMLVSYPFFASFIKAPIALSIIGILSLVIVSGLMNPAKKWIVILNAIISCVALVIFEYAAIYTYLHLSPKFGINVAFFWVNQILSLIFFFSAYLAIKTLRGALSKPVTQSKLN